MRPGASGGSISRAKKPGGLDGAAIGDLYQRVRTAVVAHEGAQVGRFAAALPADPGPVHALDPAWAPGSDILMGIAPEGACADVIQAMRQLGPDLAWRRSYGDDPRMDAYQAASGYVELLGTRGYYRPGGVAMGVGVTGPDCLYGDHRHPAGELYLVVSGGAEWRYDRADWQAHGPGDAVISAPNQVHAIRTGAVPLVVIYVWLDGDPSVRSEILSQGET